MTRILLWDTGPGEIRAGLLQNDALVEFRLIRPRRGGQMLLAAGEHYTARIMSRIGRMQAVVDLGNDTVAVLQPVPDITEGSLIEVEMQRGPYPEPGNWKLPVVNVASDQTERHDHAHWHASAEPSERFLMAAAPSLDTIICRDAAAANDIRAILKDDTPPLVIDQTKIDDAEFDMLMDQAVTGKFPLPNGELMIERTRAMTVIDVDGNADAVTLNLQAAAEIPRLLRLLDIGGQVGIDFVAVPDRDARQHVLAAFDDAAADLGPHERTAINGFGFCQIVRRRCGASVPEILCGTRRAMLSDDSRAIKLLRDTGRSLGVGKRQLTAPAVITAIIANWPEELQALQKSLGVAIELISDPLVTGYGYVHVDQS